MISGYDSVIEIECEFKLFIEKLKKRIEKVWPNYFFSFDNEEGIETWFFTKNKKSFDLMDEKGFYLENGEGPFMIMCSKPRVITLVLPESPENSVFCQSVSSICLEEGCVEGE